MKQHNLLPPRRDLVASAGVFTVAIPLSLGIALASGVPASAAIMSAIIGGLLVGALSGAPLVVTGPAAGLAALVLGYVQAYGLRGLAMITIIAGIAQIGFGLFRLGRFFALVPKPILTGMLAAIGVIIATSQVHVLLGGSPATSVNDALINAPVALLAVAQTSSLLTISLLGLTAIAIQLAWPKIARQWSWIPGALPAVVIVTILSLGFEVPRVELGSILGETLASIRSWWETPAGVAEWAYFVFPALGLALVASAETLLTARAIDTLAENAGISSKCHLDKELFAQGVGNSFAGLVGGMPMTGVIVRSAANVNFGAVTRWSTVLHGVWIAIVVIFLPMVITSVPLTALAAVLVITGFKLLGVREVVHLFRTRIGDGLLWTVTFGAILLTDLLRGLGIAIVASLLAYGLKTYKARRKPEIELSTEGLKQRKRASI